MRGLDILKLEIFVLHNTDTISFPLSKSSLSPLWYTNNGKEEVAHPCDPQYRDVICFASHVAKNNLIRTFWRINTQSLIMCSRISEGERDGARAWERACPRRAELIHKDHLQVPLLCAESSSTSHDASLSEQRIIKWTRDGTLKKN